MPPARPSAGSALGYSDPVNHALAFAAKHHHQQVWKGTRLPYGTSGANVAIVLARYEQDDETLVAGILHDVVEDYVRDKYSAEMLEQRVGEKFSGPVLETLLSIVERRLDDDGVEMSAEERKADRLDRLAAAGERARWVVAADAVHNASSLLADLRRTSYPESVWSRFSAGREATVGWFRSVHDRLADVGFDGAIMHELRAVADELEERSRPND